MPIYPPTQPRSLESRLPPNAGTLPRYAAKAIDFLFPSNDPASWMPGPAPLGIVKAPVKSIASISRLAYPPWYDKLLKAVKYITPKGEELLEREARKGEHHFSIFNRMIDKYGQKKLAYESGGLTGGTPGFIEPESGTFLSRDAIEDLIIEEYNRRGDY